MNDSNPLAAELLEMSAAGYAAAANALLQQSADLGDEFAAASTEWTAHLKQRILELASAVRINQPDLFARRISWLRKAISARGADDRAIRAALESLRAALDQELPEALKATVKPHLELALSSLDTKLEADERALDSNDPFGRLALQYLSACLEARTDEAIKLILEAVAAEVSPEDAITRVLLPAQREIGLLWHMGGASISEERLVSETTRNTMTLIVDRFAPPPNPKLRVLAASVAGNAHDNGLRAAANIFRLAGWRTLLLGADTPTDEIAKSAQSFNVSVIVLCATLTTQIRSLAEAIERVKQLAGAPPVIVGGLALEGTGDLWRKLGADAYVPDVAAVVSVASDLLGRPD